MRNIVQYDACGSHNAMYRGGPLVKAGSYGSYERGIGVCGANAIQRCAGRHSRAGRVSSRHKPGSQDQRRTTLVSQPCPLTSVTSRAHGVELSAMRFFPSNSPSARIQSRISSALVAVLSPATKNSDISSVCMFSKSNLPFIHAAILVAADSLTTRYGDTHRPQ